MSISLYSLLFLVYTIPVYPLSLCTPKSISSSALSLLTNLPGFLIFLPLIALSLLTFVGSLQLFCSQSSFSNFSLLYFKHIGTYSHALSAPPLPSFPFPICSLWSPFSCICHTSSLPAVSLDALSLASINNPRLGLVPKPKLTEIAASDF